MSMLDVYQFILALIYIIHFAKLKQSVANTNSFKKNILKLLFVMQIFIYLKILKFFSFSIDKHIVSLLKQKMVFL